MTNKTIEQIKTILLITFFSVIIISGVYFAFNVDLSIDNMDDTTKKYIGYLFLCWFVLMGISTGLLSDSCFRYWDLLKNKVV